MSYLADTHIAIWSLLEPERIPTSCREALTDRSTVKFVSVASFWEISIKYSLGKLVLRNTSPEELMSAMFGAGFHLLSLDPGDAATAWRLPRVKHHRDPFDRLMIWQCIRNDLVFLSADASVSQYRKHGLRTVSGLR